MVLRMGFYMSGLKCKHTVVVLSCMNTNLLEEEKYGPVFPKHPSGAAVQ